MLKLHHKSHYSKCNIWALGRTSYKKFLASWASSKDASSEMPSRLQERLWVNIAFLKVKCDSREVSQRMHSQLRSLHNLLTDMGCPLVSWGRLG